MKGYSWVGSEEQKNKTTNVLEDYNWHLAVCGLEDRALGLRHLASPLGRRGPSRNELEAPQLLSIAVAYLLAGEEKLCVLV